MPPVAPGVKEKQRSAMDATHLYWVNEGWTPESNDPDVDPTTLPITDGAVMKVAKAGGPPVVLARRQNGPVALAVDDQYVYFTTCRGCLGMSMPNRDRHGGTVMRVRKQ